MDSVENNWKNKVQELFQKISMIPPIYTTIQIAPTRFIASMQFNLDGELIKKTGAEGRTKKLAELKCAELYYAEIAQLLVPKTEEKKKAATAKKTISGSAKNALQEYCQTNKLDLPKYTCTNKGPPHNLLWSCKIVFDGKEYDLSQTYYKSKKDSEQAAAEKMLVYLGLNDESSIAPVKGHGGSTATTTSTDTSKINKPILPTPSPKSPHTKPLPIDDSEYEDEGPMSFEMFKKINKVLRENVGHDIVITFRGSGDVSISGILK